VTVGPRGNRDETSDHRVLRAHYAQQAIDLDRIADEFGTQRDVTTAKADVLGPPLDEVELPASSAGGEKRVAVTDVADGLLVVSAAFPSGQVEEHKPLAGGCRDREPEHESHRHVADAHPGAHSPYLRASGE
jgi:hypothetical protein